ncbi:MAG: sigma-70 family RNA polymerase sigma factor [Phycisphaera sp.]|nr:sigma-70 family RNA polymerase sigma factor [Phycisphaera sp.]
MSMDQDSVVRWLLKEQPMVLAYIRGVVGDEHLADDVFQNLTVLALHKHAEIEDDEHLPGWVRNAARYEALNLVRKRGRQRLVINTDAMELLNAEWESYDTTPGGAVVDTLRKCMEHLTPNARKMVELRYIQGMSSGAVADALQRRADSVYRALIRIRKTLAECIRRHTVEEGAAGA